MTSSVFSLDAETNGLWGQAFAIAALVYDESGMEIGRFVGRCPIEGSANEWVRDNVLPQMEGIPVSHETYHALLADFASFWLANKDNTATIAHMAVPVESNLFRDLHVRGLIGDFDGPYPLIDIAGMLLMAGEDPTSVDSYAAKHSIGVDSAKFMGETHNPLYDAAQAAVVYQHLLKNRS